METSQQQRRPAIGQLASALSEVGAEFDLLDLVDTIWLAQFMELTASEQTVPKALDSPAVEEGDLQTKDEPSQTDNGVNLYPPERNPQPQPDAKDETSEDIGRSAGTSFAVPAAPALRTRLDLARAMRPLMRKVPSRQRFDLDEEATVTRIAETEVWMPVVRPSPERWLELDLVVEDSKTTAIWERSIAELSHLAEYQGAFRAVRTWRLRAEDNRIQLFPRWQVDAGRDVPRPDDNYSAINQRPRNPRELIDPTGRRLIWVITDCTSLLWQQSMIYKTLRDWSLGQSVSIVQMFPERLWSRTALRGGYPVSLSAWMPGAASAQLEVAGLPRRLARRGGADVVTLPVVTVEPEHLAQWARVVAGRGDAHTTGRSFDLALFERQTERDKRSDRRLDKKTERGAVRPTTAAPARTAEQRVALFRSTSSKTVRKLANLMAAVPVSLPVVDLIREAFRGEFEEEVRQSHVAEVLLSGLLRRCDTEEEGGCEYAFFGDGLPDKDEQVRDWLLRDASIKDTRRVLDVLSAAIYRKLGRTPKNFEAMLREMQDLEELQEAALPFAQVGLDVLLKLGGEHAELARRVQLQRERKKTERDVAFPPFSDFTFNHTFYADAPSFPTLSTETFTIRTLQRSATGTLDTFTITVATLSQEGRQWRIQRQQRNAHRFIEPLPLASDPSSGTLGMLRRVASSIFGDSDSRGSETVPLEMVAIPGGRFLMGSPDDEPERYERESPQHEVTITPFFMGRYPVTQAQWRAVAAMPQVNRKLDPNPSRFDGESLPVEQVSWYDAMEFCDRLSAHTGRQYRLPTEAEWEYACRAGSTTAFHFGDMITTDVANYGGSAYAGGPQGKSRDRTTPVAQFEIANAYGLSDMHGNVWEWCQDHWHDSYEGAPTDGSAWLTDNEKASRVLRGGSWIDLPRPCRSAYRLNNSPGNRLSTYGFRVSCVAPRTLV